MTPVGDQIKEPRLWWVKHIKKRGIHVLVFKCERIGVLYCRRGRAV